MVPSFISMMAPTVQRKGLPETIGHEALHSTSITRKSMGTRLSLTIIITSLILPKGFFLATSASSGRASVQELGSDEPNKFHQPFTNLVFTWLITRRS
jgi:hypothetical protein